MADLTYVKINSFIEAVAEKKHNLSSDVLKVYLTNATPSASASNVKADVAEISNGGGYTGGLTVTVTASSQTGGTYTLAVSLDQTLTGAGSGFGPYTHAVLYNETAANDELIGFWSFGGSRTIAAGDTQRLQLSTPLITMS